MANGLRASACCTALARLLLPIALTACHGCPGSQDTPNARTPVSDDPVRPPSQEELATTDGTIAMSNIDVQITSATGALHRNPSEAETEQTLIDLLSLRAKFTSHVSDLEAADAWANDFVRVAPKRAGAYEARAGTRAALHLFRLAVEDLDRAVTLGASREAQASARAAILQATGDLDGALALREALAARTPEIAELTSQAALVAELGRTDEAVLLFARAQESNNQVTAFPVAWMLFQEAIMWERAGNTRRAAAFYRGAYERVPAYAHAASHLAVLEPPAKAIELLKPIVETADDPEFEMILARSELAAGDKASADQHFADVAKRYDELVAKHPEAYRDHAASFFLTEGNDKKKALDLSKQTIAEGRRIAAVYETALLAAIALGAKDDACTLAKGVQALQHPSQMLQDVAKDACK